MLEFSVSAQLVYLWNWFTGLSLWLVAAVTLPPNHQMTIFRHTTALYSCLLSAATGCWFHHGKSSIIQPIGHLSFIYHYLMHTKHLSHSLIRGLKTGSQWHFFFLFFFQLIYLSLHVVCQVVIFKKATSQPGMIVLTLAVSTDHSWSGQTGMVSLY